MPTTRSSAQKLGAQLNLDDSFASANSETEIETMTFDTDNGIDDEACQKAEQEGDDEGEDERHDAHLTELRPTVLQIPHQLLKKALRPATAEETPNHICLVRNCIGNTPREKVFAGK